MEPLNTLDLEEQWELFGDYLKYTRSTSYYGHFVKGFQKLYNFNDLYFTKKNISALSAQIVQNYSNYDAWFDSSFQKTGFELMILDQYWKPFNVDPDNPHMIYLLANLYDDYYLDKSVALAHYEKLAGAHLDDEVDKYVKHRIKTIKESLYFGDR